MIMTDLDCLSQLPLSAACTGSQCQKEAECVELTNQSDPGHNVDQPVAALKHNKVCLSNGKLLSSTNKKAP